MAKLSGWNKGIAVALAMGSSVQAKVARMTTGGTVYKYETTHFAIYYQKTDTHAVYGSSNVDGNGVPVAIDSIGAYAERSWRLAVDTLGYKAPVGMTTALYYQQAVPTGKMPIEVVDVGVANTGAPSSTPWMGVTCGPNVDPNGTGNDILIENDFLYDATLKPIRDSVVQATNRLLYDFSTAADIHKGWKVAVSHEFFHTVEYGYEYAYQYAFHEMCAVWFEIRAYPEIYHHWAYLPNFVTYKYSGAFATGSSHYYSNHAFVREFAHVFGDSAVRKVWEFRSRHMYLNTTTLTEAPWFADAMDSLGYSQVELMKDYSVQIANLLYDQPGLLNDNGLYVNQPYMATPLHSSTSPVAGEKNAETIAPYNFAFNNISYSWQTISSGMHFKVDSVSSKAYAAGYIIHLPSQKITQYDNRGADVVFAIDSGDTALSIAFVVGYPSPSVNIEFTYDAITGVAVAPKSLTAFLPKIRVDLRGRPVNSDYRGLVIESDGVKTVPAIRLR
jgi:hypothetical protein